MGNKRFWGVLVLTAGLLVGTAQPALSSGAQGADQDVSRREFVSGVKAQIVSYSTPAQRLDAMGLVAQDDKATLYYDGATAQVAVKNKVDGRVWFSSPWNTASLSADDSVKALLWTPVQLTYLDKDRNEFQYDGFTNCAALGQISSSYIRNGVRAHMVIGAAQDAALLPSALPGASMQAVLKKMAPQGRRYTLKYYRLIDLAQQTDSTVRKQFLSQYPGLADCGSVYLLKTDAQSTKDTLTAYFSDAGYTVAQMQKDNKTVLGSKAAAAVLPASFSLDVDYTLENGQLIASIPVGSIRYDRDNYTLTNIGLLPYFGAAGTSDKGFLFVPDGSGALLDLQAPANERGEEIGGKVYGADSAVTFDDSLASKMSMRMPVFGAQVNGSGFFAVIENGDAQSTVGGVVGETGSGMSTVGASFATRTTDLSVYTEKTAAGDANNQYILSEKNEYTGRYTLRYFLLGSGAADYSDMAAVYRSYLTARGQLKSGAVGSGPALYYGALGSVCTTGTFMLLPVTEQVPLTTFDDMQKIASELLGGGVKALDIRCLGWQNGGLVHTVSRKFNPAGVLGGRSGYEKLAAFAQKKHIGLFADIDVSLVYRDTLLDGFTASRDAAHMLDKTYARTYPIDFGSNLPDESSPIVAVKPARMQQYLASFLKSARGVATGLSVSDLGSELHGDYGSAGTSRVESEAAARRMLAAASAGRQVLVEGGNAYVYPYAAHVVDLSGTSSGYTEESATVPFMQMVLHGSVSYTGEAVNLAADETQAVLKAVENGEGLYFVLACRNTDALTRAGLGKYVSAVYSDWKDRMLADYRKVSQVLNGTYSSTIARHEILSPGVVRVTYSNGTKVFVNYTEKPVTVDGVAVPAQDAASVRPGTAG